MDLTSDAFGDVRDFLAGIILSAERRAEHVVAYLQENKSLGAWCRQNASRPQVVRQVLIALDVGLQLEACEWAGARATPDYDFPPSEAVLAEAHTLAEGRTAQVPVYEIGNRLLIWSARHLTWDGLQGHPLRIDPAISQFSDQLLSELAELLLKANPT